MLPNGSVMSSDRSCRFANGILRRVRRGQRLGTADLMVNRALSALRCGIEKIFGHWKRSLGYRRARYVGWPRNRL